MVDLVAIQPGSAFLLSSLDPSIPAMPVQLVATTSVVAGGGSGAETLLLPKSQLSQVFDADSGSGSGSDIPLLNVGGGRDGCRTSITPGMVEGGGVGLKLLIREWDF
jgi:hypothetical protein